MRDQHLPGTWRVRLGRQWVSLTLVQEGPQVWGMDSDRRGTWQGHTVEGAGLVVAGRRSCDDGRVESFVLRLHPSGGNFSGVLATGRRRLDILGVRQSIRVPKGLLGFLAKQQWTPDAGLGGLSFGNSKLKIFGVEVGTVPTSVDIDGPGGSKIKVGRDGVKARPPSVEKIMEEVGITPDGDSGGGGKGKDSPGGDETQSALDNQKFMRRVAMGAGAVLVVGLGIVVAKRARR